jgi:hypothetical protein
MHRQGIRSCWGKRYDRRKNEKGSSTWSAVAWYGGYTRNPKNISKKTRLRVKIVAPAAYKVVNELQGVAKSNMCMMDPVMVGACKDALGIEDKRKICFTAIITAGSQTDEYGFCNSVHLDNHDCLSRSCSDAITKLLGSVQLSLPRFERKSRYILEWVKRFGRLSVPTTCAYEFLGEFNDCSTCFLFAFFLFLSIHMALFCLRVGQHYNSMVGWFNI